VAPVVGEGGSWTELLARHRSEWVEAAVGAREVVDLNATEDPMQALERASQDDALVWLQGFDGSVDAEVRERLRTAASRGTAIVVGLAGGEAGWREAEQLREQLGDAAVVTQQLAAGSLIGSSGSPRHTAQLLVCANVEPRAASMIDPSAAPLLSGQVARLEQANRALREANVRLAREHLGVHDAAAGAVEAKRIELEARVAELEARLEQEVRLAKLHHEWWIHATDAPRYQAVDKLRDLVFRIPGVALVLRLRRKYIQASGQYSGSGDDVPGP